MPARRTRRAPRTGQLHRQRLPRRGRGMRKRTGWGGAGRRRAAVPPPCCPWLGVRPALAALPGPAELRPGGSGTDGPLLVLPLPHGAADADACAGLDTDILERPLFNPDRRPSGAARRGQRALPRLSAILIGQGMASAIFAADGQKPLVVQPGGLVAGDRVLSISADQVVLLARPVALALAPAAPPLPVPVSPLTGQPLESSFTAGPYDNE